MDVPVPTTNTLEYNALGGAIVRQSDLSSWSRCNLQKFYYSQARSDPEAMQPEILSATVYGSVVHYAIMAMEQARFAGRSDALTYGLATFEYYWHPDNIETVAERITHWLPRQTWNGLLERGKAAVAAYWVLMEDKDDTRLLALEYTFAVPLEVNGRVHTLTGTVDRLSVAKKAGKPYLALQDFKTGKQPTYLRHNVQGTAYCYATTRREFWTGASSAINARKLATFDDTFVQDLEMFFASWKYDLWDPEAPRPVARKFQWINLQEVKYVNAGWRVARDYVRLALAVDAYVRANEAGAYAPTTTGEVCQYCSFKTTCGGVGLADDLAGAPA